MKVNKQSSDFRRRGSAMFLLMSVVGVLYVLGMMLINYMTQERTQTAKLGENLQAFYLAEAGVEKAMLKVRELFSQELLRDEKVNEKLLELFDIDRAGNFTLRVEIQDGDIVPGGSAVVNVKINKIRQTPFKAYINEDIDNLPSTLNPYKNEHSDKALGGWEGMLRFEAVGKYRNTEKKLEVIRELKVTDLTPPAEDYTMFITSEKDEYLQLGEFRCRNWSVVRPLKELIDDLAKKTSSAFHETLGSTADNFFWEPNLAGNISFEGDIRVKTLSVIRKLVMSVSDIKIRDYVDISIQKLHPKYWGKIRTNGRLHVYLPFFAADDIVNYFEDNTIFSHQRPEIGYLLCNNQLHDPYLSKYTYYEGEIIRYYQKLKPYVLGITETPYPSTEPYTINTKFDFVSDNPNKLEPMQLGRIKKNAKDYCHEFIEKDLILQGTYSKPASIMGLIYVQGNVYIGGRISGKAMIVTEGNIFITEDVIQDGASSLLSLVSLKGSVKVAAGLKSVKIESAIYSKNSITGGEELNIFGNLVVDTLNRQNVSGQLIMPKRVMITYDPKINSEIGNNISFNISEQITTMRNL